MMPDDDTIDPIVTTDGEPVGHITLEQVQPEEPWERQPEETNASWKAFQLFRDMGLERSINAIAKTSNGGKSFDTNKKKGVKGSISSNYSKYHKWAKKYNWEVRALAYDKMLDKKRIDQAIKDAQKMTERHIGLGVMLQARGAKRVKEMSEEEVVRMTLPNAIKMINEGVEIERLSRGLPTSNVNQQVSGKIEHKSDDRVLDEVRNTRDMLAGKIDELERRKASTRQLIQNHRNNPEDEEKASSVETIRKELLPHLGTIEDVRVN